jgi:formylglycine-generating enzyme required for sulfatase activity
VVRIALFEDDQIDFFLHRWYAVRGRKLDWDEERCKQEARSLSEAIKDPRYHHLRELARYPLLLTMMAQLHGKDGSLPDDRADLYERIVTLLLATWQNRLVRDVAVQQAVQSDRILYLDMSLSLPELREVLERVAFTVHEQQQRTKDRDKGQAAISRLLLLEALREKLGGSLDAADTVLAYIQQRAGILVARDKETYAFPHKTFQEYLAACHFIGKPDFFESVKAKLEEDVDWWREVFLLAAIRSAQTTPHPLVTLIDTIVEEGRESNITPLDAVLVMLLSQALREARFPEMVKSQGGGSSGLYSRKLRLVQDRLTATIGADNTLNPKERAASGRELARLGDPRPEVMTIEGMRFCYVPAGPFQMGSENYDKEKPRREIDIPYAYWIGRYPVTQAQFAAFTETGGYQTQRWWTSAGWKFIKKNGRTAPSSYREPSSLPNHPVIGVTWYEAQAFVAWLTEKARDAKWISRGGEFVLPNEPEWEKAARGGRQIPEGPPSPVALATLGGHPPEARLVANPDPGRQYPWGVDIDPGCCNYDATKIGSTSTPGCFSTHASPYGVQEMAGNVWEWSRSTYRKEGYSNDKDTWERREILTDDASRVLRGGSFFNSAFYARCASRYGYYPYDVNGSVGFRVVFAPPYKTV